MMKSNYYCAKMKNIDSLTIDAIAKQLYGNDAKIFLGEDGKRKQVTLEELENIQLIGKRVTIENCDKSVLTKPAYVSLMQLENKPDAFVKGPDYSLEIEANNGIAEIAMRLIEKLLSYR